MITEKEQKFVAYWEEKRKAGRLWYSFRQGVLFFSWPVYLLSELFKYVTRKADYTFNFTTIAKGFFIWTILGFIAFGTLMWWTYEKQYRAIKKKEGQ